MPYYQTMTLQLSTILLSFYVCFIVRGEENEEFLTREKRKACIFGGSADRCFDELGCFPCFQKFEAYSPEKIGMEFYLHTFSNKEFQTIGYVKNDETGSRGYKEDIKNINFDTDKDLWVIIHGFEAQWPLPWLEMMSKELLKKGNNVLKARWSDGTAYYKVAVGGYYQAASNARVVGKMIAKVLQSMRDQKGLNFDKVNLVAFSLGPHVAGYVGAACNGTLKHIVGLDPAAQTFEDAEPQYRLDKTDAKMVQVIHTHGAPLSSGGLGTMKPMGDVDIYVNGGLKQPGCKISERDNFNFNKSSKIYSAIKVVGCNHLRAPAIFTDSIRQSKCEYRAYPCDSTNTWNVGGCFKCGKTGCVNMGYHLLYSDVKPGKYYLSTLIDEGVNKPRFAYCGKQYRMSMFADQKIRGEIDIAIRGPEGVKTNYAEFMADKDYLDKAGRAKIVAANVDPVKIDLKYDRYNILIKKSKEEFTLTHLSLEDDTGLMYGTNESYKIIDDGLTTIALEKGNYRIAKYISGSDKTAAGFVLISVLLSIMLTYVVS